MRELRLPLYPIRCVYSRITFHVSRFRASNRRLEYNRGAVCRGGAGLVGKGALLAQGRTAEIFAWGGDAVLKLLRSGFPAEDMAHEARVTAQVHAVGVPAPAVMDQVEVDGRAGIILERVRGPSLLHCIAQRPWRLLTYAHLLADLHADLHTRTI